MGLGPDIVADGDCSQLEVCMGILCFSLTVSSMEVPGHQPAKYMSHENRKPIVFVSFPAAQFKRRTTKELYHQSAVLPKRRITKAPYYRFAPQPATPIYSTANSEMTKISNNKTVVA